MVIFVFVIGVFFGVCDFGFVDELRFVLVVI